jgi:hypothetical protein
MGARSGGIAVAVTLVVAASGAAVQAPAAAAPAKPRAALKSVGTCGALARYARRHARAVILREQKDDGRKQPPDHEFTPPSPSPPSSPGAPAAGEGGSEPRARDRGGSDFSGTNVQEEGIDEPDMVKTDGRHMFVSTGDSIYALDARAEHPGVLGTVKTPGYEPELLLVGDRLLAIAYADDGERSATVLAEIDVSNPAAMRVLRTEKVEGDYVSARLHGNVARVVIWTEPREIVVEQPADADWSAQERRARRRLAVKRARVRTWRPNEVIADRTTGVRRTRGAVPCSEVRRPRAHAGLEMLTVLTVDMDRGLPSIDADGVFASGDTVYAGDAGLYVATGEWHDDRITSIHKFAIDGAETAYRASGTVPGYMLSQWSMSEHEGHLRTATTSRPPEDAGRQGRASESQVLVLAERDGTLAEVGRAGGLGRGESIYAVRFMGDRGFVVTFEEIDPLYTLDLSDPARPRVAGELKIPGYSSYLHPVAENVLLGVGQDVRERETRGLQLSLFDVSDPARPRRTAVHTLAGEAWTEAEWDHRAFLYWPPTRLAVLPVEIYPGPDAPDSAFDDPSQTFGGAIGFRVGAADIAEAGRVTEQAASDDSEQEPEYYSAPTRNVVVGDRLFSIWWGGVRVSRLDDMAPVGWVELRR